MLMLLLRSTIPRLGGGLRGWRGQARLVVARNEARVVVWVPDVSGVAISGI